MNNYYLAVPVGERFPEHSGRYKCIDKDGEAHTMNFNRGNNFFHWPVSGSKTGKDFITHWLEPREGVLLQREELENWGYEKKNLEMQIAHRQYLIEAQKEYIEFLGKNISDNAVYLQVHGMAASEETVAKGIELRNKISSLTSKTEVK